MGACGNTEIDFGAFPGGSDASLVITGQAGIIAGSCVEAWLYPKDTADHLADEHVVETLRVMAGAIVPGVGFTIYASNTSQLNEMLMPFMGVTSVLAGQLSAPQNAQRQFAGGRGTRIYGLWSVGWVWV